MQHICWVSVCWVCRPTQKVRRRAMHPRFELRSSDPKFYTSVWIIFFSLQLSITLHDMRNICPACRDFYFVIEISPWWQLQFFTIIFSVLWDQYTFKYFPIHQGIISPNFFVPAYICQLYNPFITRKSFGKQQIKAGIIKGFLLKHAFFEHRVQCPPFSPCEKMCFLV